MRRGAIWILLGTEQVVGVDGDTVSSGKPPGVIVTGTEMSGVWTFETGGDSPTGGVHRVTDRRGGIVEKSGLFEPRTLDVVARAVVVDASWRRPGLHSRGQSAKRRQWPATVGTAARRVGEWRVLGRDVRDREAERRGQRLRKPV
jgi:hypothetical protein